MTNDFVMVKETSHLRNITLVNLPVPKNTVPQKFTKKTIEEGKDFFKSTIISLPTALLFNFIIQIRTQERNLKGDV